MTRQETYRDIVYFDSDKIQSILAQLNKGLIISTINSNNSEHQGEGKLKTNKLLEALLQFPISGEGSYSYTKIKGLQEEKSLHDFALSELLEVLPFGDVTSLSRKQFDNNHKTFIKVKGEFSLYDYEDLARTIERVNLISSIMGDNNEKNDLDSFADFIKTAYEGLTAIEISNKQNVKFLGPIKSDHLRETMRNLLFKYGGTPKGDWEMICQITNVPERSSDSLQQSMNKMGKGIDPTKIQNENSLSPFVNDIVNEFSKINDLFSSVSYPNISVEPIAIYKEIIM